MKKSTKKNIEAICGYTVSVASGCAVTRVLTDVFHSLSDPTDSDTDTGMYAKIIRNSAAAAAIGMIVTWKWMDTVSSYIIQKYN